LYSGVGPERKIEARDFIMSNNPRLLEAHLPA